MASCLAALMLFSLGAHAADPPAAATYRALDDKLYVLGTDNDFQITYDSGDNRVEIRDAAGNVLGRVSDAGTTGVIGFVQHDVINGSYASQITSAATANRAVTLPDAAGEISLLGQTIATGEIVDGTIANADVSASAAIAATKLDAGTNGQAVVTAGGVSGWGTVPSAGITDDTIVNADINSAAAIAITKLATTGASSGYVLTYNGSAIVWAASAAVGDISAGTNLDVDNLVPRTEGTGEDTLQGYSSNPITASDAGLLSVPGGITTTGYVEIDGGALRIETSSDFFFMRDDEIRWSQNTTTGTETGTTGETALAFDAYDNDGNFVRRAMQLNRTASEGVVIGSVAAPTPLYVKGDIYAHTDDSQIVDDGKVLLAALAQTSATTGQSMVWNGTNWAPSSVAVNWGSPGAIGSVSPSSGSFTTLNASSATFSEALIADDNRLSWGTDLDIQVKYDEATDNRLEFSDGTNLLAYLTDAGTEGQFGVNALRVASGSTGTVYDDATTINVGKSDGSSAVNLRGLYTFSKTPIYFDTTTAGTGAAIFVMGPAGTNRHFARLFTGNNETTGKRWDFYANSDLETGGDAGSNIKFGAYDDSGSFIDNVWEIWRAPHGEIKFGNDGRDIRLGDDTLARDIALRIETAAGQNRFIAYQTAGTNRFTTGVNDTAESGSNAGSDWFLKALADNGADIDFPIIVRRVAGGDIDIARRIDSSAGALFTTVGTSGNATLGDGTGDSHVINGNMIGNQSSTSSTLWANYNTNTGTAAFAQTVVGNVAATTDAVSILCLSTGYTTSGGFRQDGGALAANTNLSGGLSIMARESSADVRIYAGGSADGDLVATFDDAQLATFEGAMSVKGNLTFGDASTDTITLTARTLLTSVTDAGPMTATNGTERQIVYNESDSKVYICTVTGSPATWAALN